MKKFLKLMVARRLAATPIGLAALGIGWFLGRRRRKQRARHESTRVREHAVR
ncbi:DUF6203 family protein [Nonomuraea sp. NPDC050643]|uniref:DUF6203 family protein n=1 Tax=Nonomuraea sp. NPDC050643 TaxID=3155660 RepID=UPI0033CAD90C